ncbi:AAA family ATPase [Klebsiella pneumoniae]|uniref:AAA family ATPase n=1 Tax=Klebsiella pneumoniae TaxID=573 RepID=UPI001F5B4468|nr:AAA family ATPase [Klebsiella pneumoniae]
MIKNIEISNFKIIESLKLSSLKRVNVIAGKNGKGKTSILDSIFITNDIASPDCLIKPIAFRGGSPDLTNNELWLSYFRDFDRKNEISIKMELENSMKQETRVSIENIKSDTSNIGTVSSNVIERNQISPRSSYRGDVLKIRKYDRSQPESLSMKMEVTQQISGNQLTSNLVKHGSGIDATATTFITTSSTINNTNTISVLGNLIKNKDTKSIIESMKEINDKILNIELGGFKSSA